MKEIVLVCFSGTLEGNNGYAKAFEFYRWLAREYHVYIRIIVPFVLNVWSEEVKPFDYNMTVQKIVPGKMIQPSEDYWDLYSRLCEDVSLKDKFKAAAANADLIIANTIYFATLAKTVFPDKRVIFRSLDVELDKAKWFLECTHTSPFKKENFPLLYDYEKKAYEIVDQTFVLTQDDAERLHTLYGISESKIRVLPLCEPAVSLRRRLPPALKERSKKCLILSMTPMDRQEHFEAAAANLPEVEFHLVGKCCNSIQLRLPNIILHGVIDEETKKSIMAQCDFALHLSSMTFGMNTKVAEFFLGGIPVLANEQGMRGYGAQRFTHYFPADFETLKEDIQAFCKLAAEARHEIALNAFQYICENHTYEKYRGLFNSLLGPSRADFSYFIFGAGQTGKGVLQELRMRNKNCLGFISNSMEHHGKDFCGLKVFSPKEAFEEISKHPNHQKLIVAVSKRYCNEVLEQALESLDKGNVAFRDPYTGWLIDMETMGDMV